ncbi:hypothetical protein BDN67DRAFT_39548 [Paxillus ammoniavirescens]|nr:hypothetical protein BDN67DRAFT_39548 [Paxillus ammoniavirescens]
MSSDTQPDRLSSNMSILRHRDSSASNIELMPESSSSPNNGGSTSTPPVVDDSQGLSEAQLRQLYDEEEVERFMHFFSAYVTEVRLPGIPASTDNTYPEGPAEAESAGSMTPPLLPRRPTDRSLSEYIAYEYVLPCLPPGGNPSPQFTLKRLRLTSQRFYLATVPLYQTFLLDLAHLALWKDYRRSTRYCISFWFLWFHDLLLPALMFRILWSLLRHRLLPYHALQELQERREATARAHRFGEEVQERLSVTTLGPIDMWRLFKLYKAGTKEKISLKENKFPEQESANLAVPSIIIRTAETNNEPTLLDHGDSREEECLKRDLLHLLNELADLHERIKNIFTWCRPAVSRRYALLLAIASFGVLALPAQYVAKLTYLFGGIAFWHVVPVVAALPRADIARVPPAFGDAPTDADYAMELIARRIAAGQDVGISAQRNIYRHRASNASTVSLTGSSFDISREAQSSDNDGINWKKWGERVAHGKSLMEEGKQLMSSRTSVGQTPSMEETATRGPGAERTHTFPAQYASTPGLITLTPTTLYFTTLTATRAKLVIPCDRLRGVKKSGLVKGISMTWVPTDSVDGREREERFHWVGNRDELFARLLGPDGGRWMRI